MVIKTVEILQNNISIAEINYEFGQKHLNALKEQQTEIDKLKEVVQALVSRE